MAKRFVRTSKTVWDNIPNKSDYNNSIVFIEDANTIWSNGVAYSGDGYFLPLSGGTCTGPVSATAFFETSDSRKKDVKSDLPLEKCYDLIDKCQTIIYSLKEENKDQLGMIAQEVEEFFPELVNTDEEGFKSLSYDRLVVICFKVLKDVIKRLEKLEDDGNWD